MAEPDVTAIAIAVVARGGHFLVGRRPQGVPLAGLWEFPGGKVLPGESAAAAACRECREETGLEVQALTRLMTVRHRYPHGVLEMEFFACAAAPGADQPRAPFCWVEAGRLTDYAFPPANAPLIRRLAELEPGDWPPLEPWVQAV